MNFQLTLQLSFMFLSHIMLLESKFLNHSGGKGCLCVGFLIGWSILQNGELEICQPVIRHHRIADRVGINGRHVNRGRQPEQRELPRLKNQIRDPGH